MYTVRYIAVVAVYVGVLTYVALRARTAKKFSEFSLASRALPLALVFGSLTATYVGPAFSIGFVGKGYKSGALFLCIALAYSVQNILAGVLVAPKLRELKNCHTLGDAIGLKYGRTAQVLAGIISVGICAGFAAVMAKAGGVVLNDIFGLPLWSSVIIIVGVTALYTTFGGLRASVITDAFQFTAFAILLPTILLFVLFHAASQAVHGAAALGTAVSGAAASGAQGSLGIQGVHGVQGVPAGPWAQAFFEKAVQATREGFGSMSTAKIISLAAALMFGEMLIPPYANRALASKTTAISRNSFVLAGIFSVFWFVVMIALGISARGIIPAGTKEDYVLLNLVKNVMPAEGYVLLLVVSVSIVMSSLDSLLNAGAVAFTQDIARPFTKLSDSASLNMGRSATIVIAIIAAAGAVVVPGIVQGLLICYTIWAPAILPSLVIGLWTKKPCPLAAILSMITGTIVAITLQWLWNSPVAEGTAIIPAIAAALLAYILGYRLEKFLKGRA